MAPPRLNRIVREGIATSLVEQAKVDRFVNAIGRHPHLATLRWARQRRGLHELCSGYGTLQVSVYFRGCWTITRDGAPLVHIHSGEEAVVAGLAGAKASGLLHLSDGFGSSATINDGLCWNLNARRQYEP
jgi:hypothetical protein